MCLKQQEKTTWSNDIRERKVERECKLTKAFSTCVIDPLHPTAKIVALVFLLSMSEVKDTIRCFPALSVIRRCEH